MSGIVDEGAITQNPSGAVVTLDQGVIIIDDGQEDEDQSQKNNDDEILRIARERLDLASEAESEIRRLALDDLNFRAGNQWPDNIKQERERDNRPCLVTNRLPQFIQQVTNDQRQNRPAIKIHPVSDGAQVETAKVMQGLIRHIEYNSNAEVAYDTAFESAATGGFGYFRILPDFASPDSFDLELFIKRIRNPMSVFFDPYSQEPDGSDAQWAFVVDDLSPDEYRAKYPHSKLASQGMDLTATGNNPPDWVKSDTVRVAEYFYIEQQEKRIHLLKTGEVVEDHELADRQLTAQQANIDASVVRSRIAKVPVVHWLKINGIEIIERTIFPGSYIPIIPVYGAEVFVDGKRILESVIRHAKDPQRMLNYWKSAETETIALAPRAPYIAVEGQLEGYENDWKTANRRNHAYLYYKPTSIAGQPAPPPQRQAFEPATQAITQAAMLAADDLKATTGIYDAALGQQSPDQSGVTIQRRINQAQTSNFHFFDNLTRSLKHTGRILVELLPKIYDTARSARIIGEDGTQKIVRVNQEFKDESGKPQIYSLDVGRYDVTIDTGPSYASKRQEAMASMADLSRAYPQLMGIAGDLMVKNMDWPGAQEIADRIKLTLPPQLQADPKQQQAQVPPMVQAQMQQMQMMIKQLTDHLNETTKIIETKKLDLEHRERIELWNIQFQEKKLQVDIEKTMAELGSQASVELLKQEIGVLKHQSELLNARLQLLSVNQPIDAPNDFNPQAADGGNYAGVHVGSGPTGGLPPGSPMENQP